jgi:glutathione S-transferase
MPYRLHIANKNYSSWSLRPWVLMRELGIAFEECMHPFDQRESFFEFSPTGKVPCLHDGDIVVWDSLAIVEHLAESVARDRGAESHPGVWPSDPRARAWARSAAAEIHSGFAALRQHCSMSCGIRVRLHEHPDALAHDVKRIDALWSEGLRRFGGPFLAGPSFGAVDAFFAPVAFRVQTYALELGDAAAEYAQRLLDLPSMQQWYADALAESWRDAGHEVELRAAGRWTADLRAGA